MVEKKDLDWFSQDISTLFGDKSPEDIDAAIKHLFIAMNNIPGDYEGSQTLMQKELENLKGSSLKINFLLGYANNQNDVKSLLEPESNVQDLSYTLLKDNIDNELKSPIPCATKINPFKEGFKEAFKKHYLHAQLGDDSYKDVLKERKANKSSLFCKKSLYQLAQHKATDKVLLSPDKLDKISQEILNKLSTNNHKLLNQASTSSNTTNDDYDNDNNSIDKNVDALRQKFIPKVKVKPSMPTKNSAVIRWCKKLESFVINSARCAKDICTRKTRRPGGLKINPEQNNENNRRIK